LDAADELIRPQEKQYDFVNNVAGISLLGVNVNGVAQADVLKPAEKSVPVPRDSFRCEQVRLPNHIFQAGSD
jgi:hypothetical protein